jgi:hypothetical protein
MFDTSLLKLLGGAAYFGHLSQHYGCDIAQNLAVIDTWVATLLFVCYLPSQFNPSADATSTRYSGRRHRTSEWMRCSEPTAESRSVSLFVANRRPVSANRAACSVDHVLSPRPLIAKLFSFDGDPSQGPRPRAVSGQGQAILLVGGPAIGCVLIHYTTPLL